MLVLGFRCAFVEMVDWSLEEHVPQVRSDGAAEWLEKIRCHDLCFEGRLD